MKKGRKKERKKERKEKQPRLYLGQGFGINMAGHKLHSDDANETNDYLGFMVSASHKGHPYRLRRYQWRS